MSFFTLIALIVLPILGGFIAWAGDIIGYRLGKSRRTLFGLRPRTTARLIAVIVGIVLPLATMMVAAFGSRNVRIALFQLTELQASRAALEEENQRLQASVQSSRQQKELAQKAATEAQQRVEAARQRLAAAQADLKRAEASLRETQGQLQRVREERTRLSRQVSDLEARSKGLQQQLGQTQAALAQTQARLREAQAQEERLKQEVQRLVAEAHQARVEADAARRELEDAQRDLVAATDELERKREELERTEALTVALTNTWLAQSFLTATTEVRYEPGTELLRQSVRAAQSEAQIVASLEEMLVLASRLAAAAGAGRDPDTGRAVVLFAPIPPGATDFPPQESAVIREVARQIREARAEEYVVVVRVVFRSFVGDDRPVGIGLFARPNDLVFKPGAVIASRQIDGSKPRAEVFQRLWGLLSDLRVAAQEAGLMRDPQTGQYGQVPAEAILAALDELLQRKQTLLVEAVAAQDVYVASEEPFLVLLRVREPEGGGGGG